MAGSGGADDFAEEGMSEIRFTPGPWDIDPKNTDEVYAGNGMIAVAECDGQSWDQIEANAHLIAAAPDLYRAAEYFEWCADGNGDGTANHCAVCEAHQRGDPKYRSAARHRAATPRNIALEMIISSSVSHHWRLPKRAILP